MNHLALLVLSYRSWPNVKPCGLIADSPVEALMMVDIICSVCDRWNKVALQHALHNAMHFLWLRVSLSPSPCQSVGWLLPSGPSPTSPSCNSWPCWCLPDPKALSVFHLSENLLPDVSQKSVLRHPKHVRMNLDQSEMFFCFLTKCCQKKESTSACESKAAVHWESGSIIGTILANANVPMIPQCCYGKLPPASPHLRRTAAVYPQLPTALPTALPG